MTCENQCQDDQCPNPELCANYDEKTQDPVIFAMNCIDAVFMCFMWFCLVLLAFFGWALFVFLS